MGKTRDVMKDRRSDPNKIITDQKLTDYLEMSNLPGRKAYTLFLFMLKQEPGLLDYDRKYTVTLSDLRKNAQREKCQRIRRYLKELNKTEIHFVDAASQKEVWGHLIEEATADYSQEGLLTITLKIGSTFRSYMNKSELFSILDRTVIEAFKSKYGVFLYQRLAGMQGYTKTHAKKWTTDELRKVLSVPKGKLIEGNDLIRWGLEPAIEDINAHAPFTVDYKIAKANRRISEITVSWKQKPGITKNPTDLKPTSLNDWPKITEEQFNKFQIEPELWNNLRPRFCHWIRTNGHDPNKPKASDRTLQDFLEEIKVYKG